VNSLRVRWPNKPIKVAPRLQSPFFRSMSAETSLEPCAAGRVGRITACPAVGAPHKPPRVMRRSEQALYRSACQLGAALGLPLWAYWPILQPWVPCPHGLSGLIPFIGPRFTSLSLGSRSLGWANEATKGARRACPAKGNARIWRDLWYHDR